MQAETFKYAALKPKDKSLYLQDVVKICGHNEQFPESATWTHTILNTICNNLLNLCEQLLLPHPPFEDEEPMDEEGM